MSRRTKWPKRIVVILLAGGAAFAVAVSLKPERVLVQTSPVVRGPMLVTVDAAGKTRLLDKDTLAAPAAGELTKIALRPGDRVEANQVVAEILPGTATPLDARTKSEIMARLGAAQASLAEAQRNVERAEIVQQLADKEAARSRDLHARGAIASDQLDRSESAANARLAELELAKTSVERSRRESAVVAAALHEPNKPGKKGSQRVAVRAPRSGTVLRVHQQSAGPVQPGSLLLDIGDLDRIEFVVDLPTQSAMKIKAGAPVRIDGLGDERILAGKVKLVEPAAFTKITALGVEEQRVNVIVISAGDTKPWASLGDGFAADAHIEIQKADDVLKVPLGAVFRDEGRTSAFCIDGERTLLVKVEIGNRSAEEVEIRSGIGEGTLVVVHPSDKLAHGALIQLE